jgi:nicotinate-nucleotide pyrophosphorylase (carboxylating)
MNDDIVKLALSEDIGALDASADLLQKSNVDAHIISKEAGIICGIEYATRAFYLVDSSVVLDWQVCDGQVVQSNQVLCKINGLNQSILSAERVALNFLQTLSAVATQTHYFVQKISHTQSQLLDTRKTLPGLREAQKYAVKCGGGVNHRMGLYDCIMLKENHIQAAGSIKKAVVLAQIKHANMALIVEVETLTQLAEVLKIKGIDRILCDNFDLKMLTLAVKMAKGKISLEASGNINENNLVSIAETGVNYLSIGAITKNIQALDLSLRFV